MIVIPDYRNPEHREVIQFVCAYVKKTQVWSCMTKNRLIEQHDFLLQTYGLILLSMASGSRQSLPG